MPIRTPLLFAAALLAGCTTDKDADSGDTAADTWTIVADDQPAAYLSVWGTGADDVFIAGADAGSGPAFAHFDGTAWSPITLGSTGDLWWVTGTGAASDTVWLGGAGGRVLQFSRAAGTATETVLDPTIIVFGIWGATDDDVWAVGGDVNAPSDTAQVWHYDGTTWTRSDIPSEAAARFAVYKVWGRSSTDVYAVGTTGLGMHWDGTAWTTMSMGTSSNLFTVHGDATDVWAVGGDFSGEIQHSDGGAFTAEAPSMALQINGVYGGGDTPYAVGASGGVYMRGGATWMADPRGAPTPYDLHSVYVDDAGGVWTVGGHLSSFPLDHGIVVYGGGAAVPAL
jgi:hypothetical protein